MASLSWPDAARLLRRTGFGTTGARVDALAGHPVDTSVAAIVAADPTRDPGAVKTPVPAYTKPHPAGGGPAAVSKALRGQAQDLVRWWINRMLTVEQPFGERLTFAWHGVFCSGASKVRSTSFMAGQNELFRTHGRGDFHDLARAVLTDPAMTRYLDNDTNIEGAPNENLAREFMELFTLGVDGGYTEQDVREGARALTGWVVDDDTGACVFDASRHDNGSKTFLGHTGDFGADDYCDIVLSQPTSAPFVVNRLWMQLVSDQPADADTVQALVTAYGEKRDLGAALTAMYSLPAFTAAAGTKVVSPVEWTIGLARALGVPTEDQNLSQLTNVLTTLGQQPFYPPSVGGWPLGQGWLSTAAVELRLRFSEQIVGAGDVSAVADEPVAQRVEAAAHLFGIPTWSDRSAAALNPVRADPPTLVAFAANTPEYLTV